MTTTEDSGSGNGVSTGGHGVGNGGGGVIIMENLIEKSLYDIGDPDLMDVWDTDLNAVRKERRTNERARNCRTSLRKMTAPRRVVQSRVFTFHFGPQLRAGSHFHVMAAKGQTDPCPLDCGQNRKGQIMSNFGRNPVVGYHTMEGRMFLLTSKAAISN